MSYTPKDNSGSLWKNDRREKDTHPNAKGSCVIGGVEYWISSWTRETAEGQKYQSLAFEPKQKQQQAPQRTHSQMKRGSREIPDPDPGNGDRFDRDFDDGPPF